MAGGGGWDGIQVNGENTNKFEVTWWVGNDPSGRAEVGRRRRRQLGGKTALRGMWERCGRKGGGREGEGENWERITASIGTCIKEHEQEYIVV